ncbi:MAG: hypothetical protein HYW06_10330 [Gemmatimonadetes bacterium]|nr:hypothetical protein [Gemmatimonadota bacterium]
MGSVAGVVTGVAAGGGVLGCAAGGGCRVGCWVGRAGVRDVSLVPPTGAAVWVGVPRVAPGWVPVG